MRLWLLLAVGALAPTSEELKVQALKEAPPADVPEVVRKGFGAEGLRVLKADQPYVDVWLRKALPVGPANDQLGVLFPTLLQGAVVGLIRFHAGAKDFRAHKFAAGVYTLRYLVQPEDGDHQGTTDTRDFLLLCPAASETTADPLKAEDAVKLSGKASSKKHPAVLYLIKADAEAAVPRMVSDEQNQRWSLECEAPADGKKLRLGIVVVGKAADH